LNRKLLLNFFKFLLFLGLGLGILYLVYRGQNAAFQDDCALRGVPASECSLLGKVVADFRGANFFWLGVVLLLFVVSCVSRALRWNMLLRPLGYQPRFSNSFWSIILGYFANLGLPRMGELVRAGTLAQYEKIAVEKVMGTLVVDRVIDVISILLLTGLAVLIQYGVIMDFVQAHVDLGDRMRSGALLGYAFLVFLIVAVILYKWRQRIRRLKIYGKLANIAWGFRQGLVTIRRLDNPWGFVAHSINIWLMYFLMVYACFFAFAPTAHLTPLAALVVHVFGAWGVVVPSPGGMGTYHFLAQTALQMYGVGGDDAFSWANISFFTIQLGCNVILGVAALFLLPALNRRYFPSGASVAALPADHAASK
jgi:uncharacterized protein (TIRG00374 family)